jgi:hypothetical protein
MYATAGGTRDRFIGLAAAHWLIGDPPLNYQARSWAAVHKGSHLRKMHRFAPKSH